MPSNAVTLTANFTYSGGGSDGGSSSGGGYTPPTPTPTPDAKGDTGKKTDLAGGSIVDTPPGQDPIINEDGSITLPGGGTITTPEGDNGKGGVTISVPPGTVIDSDGRISFPQGSGSGTITDSCCNTFNVPEEAVIILDLDSPLGYYIIMGKTFSDVKDSDWFYDALMFAYGHGLIVGTSTDPMMFSPNATTTRGMIVTILYRMAGSPDVSDFPSPFGDVATGTWYTDAVIWAASVGIVSGYTGGGLYNPNAPITRQDLAVILARYANYMGINLPSARDYAGFIDDADIANYAKEAIERFFKAGIVSGYPDGSVKPQGEATRAEVAAMLMRFLEAMNSDS